MVKKRCTFKNLEENLKKPERFSKNSKNLEKNSENLEKISKKPLATMFIIYIYYLVPIPPRKLKN